MSYFNAIDYHSSTSPSTADASKKGENPPTTFSAHGLLFPRAFIDAVGPEETTAFFLMGQYLKGEKGFWFPYLRTLPKPGSLTTPLYYEGADLEWLEGTSLWGAREQRVSIWREKYESSLGKLREVGLEGVEMYSW